MKILYFHRFYMLPVEFIFAFFYSLFAAAVEVDYCLLGLQHLLEIPLRIRSLPLLLNKDSQLFRDI